MNRAVHERDADFGYFAARYAPSVSAEVRARKLSTLLDYGAGKGAIKDWFTAGAPDITVTEYDPAVPGKDSRPEPADAVCCIATMEHIEPDCLDEVLDDIRALGRHLAYFVICTKKSGGHMLPDGRNPHLIVEPPDWWKPHLEKRWPFVRLLDVGKKNFVAICTMDESHKELVSVAGAMNFQHVLAGLVNRFEYKTVTLVGEGRDEILRSHCKAEIDTKPARLRGPTDAPADLIYVQTPQGQAAAREMLASWWVLVKENGAMCGAGYNNEHENAGVRRAVASMFCLMDVTVGPESTWIVFKRKPQ